MLLQLLIFIFLVLKVAFFIINSKGFGLFSFSHEIANPVCLECSRVSFKVAELVTERSRSGSRSIVLYFICIRHGQHGRAIGVLAVWAFDYINIKAVHSFSIQLNASLKIFLILHLSLLELLYLSFLVHQKF